MRPHVQGFTLFEITLSLFILSLLITGLTASSLITLSANRASYYFAVAANQIQNLREQTKVLSNTDRFQKAFHAWNDENKNLLPQGVGDFNKTTSAGVISLRWGITDSTCSQTKPGLSGCVTEAAG
jgi:Tfp pilus assembly protein PilV